MRCRLAVGAHVVRERAEPVGPHSLVSSALLSLRRSTGASVGPITLRLSLDTRDGLPRRDSFSSCKRDWALSLRSATNPTPHQ